MIEITVKLKIKGQEIELTQAEARQLYDSLSRLFPSPVPVTMPVGPIFRDWGAPERRLIGSPGDWPSHPVITSVDGIGGGE